MSLIDVRSEDNVGFLYFKNSAKRNAFSKKMAEEIIDALRAFQGQKIPVVVLRADDTVAVWSAGSDIHEFPPSHKDPLGYHSPIQKLFRAVQEYPGAVIAMVHGGAYGAAFELVLTCDIAVGDETCSFAITPVKFGLPYNMAGIVRLANRLPLNILKEMFFTAQTLSAEKAEKVCILNHLVPSGQLSEFTIELAKRIASLSNPTISVTKEEFRLLSRVQPINPDDFERLQDLRQQIYSGHDYQKRATALFPRKAKPENAE